MRSEQWRISTWLRAAIAAVLLTVPSVGGAEPARVLKATNVTSIGRTAQEVERGLERYRALGFDGVQTVSPVSGIVDIGILFQGDTEGGKALSPQQQRRVMRASSDRTGVRFHGVTRSYDWQSRLSSPSKGAKADAGAALKQAIRDAANLGASSVTLVPGQVSGEEETHQDVWNRSVTGIRKVLPLAAQLKIRILIENASNGFCEKPGDLARYIDQYDSPWIGVCLDIGNAQRLYPVETWIRALDKRIIKLEVSDWSESKRSYCRLGDGDVNWEEVRKALTVVEFSGWATRDGHDKSLEDTVELMDQLVLGTIRPKSSEDNPRVSPSNP